MSEYFKNKYRTTSTRLPDFDYGSDGEYFVTICTKERELFFGEIKSDELNLSQEGKLAEGFWKEIPQHFPNIILDEFVVMPNHIHGILTIDNSLDTNRRDVALKRLYKDHEMSRISPKPGSIPVIIRSFKSICSREIRKINPDFGWQSRYYDHIIKDQKSFLNIQEYIKENPYKWAEDENNPLNIKPR